VVEEKDIKRYLLINLPGYGFRGDKLSVKQQLGKLVVVNHGVKHFCIESKYLSVCPALQQQEAQK
jgi:hypothetical protein